MKRTDFFESLRLRLPAMPRLIPADGGAPLQFASSGGGGGGGYDDPDDDYYDDYDDEPAPPRRDDTERQPTAARRRTVQSEPDDRYWTDYLRIALPVIGLLLVIAVFWFWAQQLIDDPEDDLTPTEAPGIAEVVESPTQPPEDQQETVATPPTDPPPTQAPVVTPTPEQVEAEQPGTGTDDQQETTDGTDNQVQADPDQGAEEPAQEDPGAEGIAPDMSVAVSEDGEGLRMRAEASTTAEIVTELSAGESLTVVSGPQSGEDYVWWEVADQAGNIGWVAEDFIEPAE